MADCRAELHSELERLGFSFVRKNKHEIWKYRTGAILTVSASASDHRAVKNILGDAKRIIRRT